MKSKILITVFCLSLFTVFGQNKTYISTEKAIEEIDSIIKKIEEVHYNPYFKIDKEQFYNNKKCLINEFDKDSITYLKFIASGMKLVAQLSGGHTKMAWQNKNIMSEFKTSQFIPFTGELKYDTKNFVITSSTLDELNKGDIIESINGIPMIDLYKECMSYVGGIESFKNSYCSMVLPIYIYFTEKISAPYSIKLKEKEIETKGINLQKLAGFLNKSMPKKNYTFEIIEDSVGVISYNKCEDLETFKIFLEETFVFKLNGKDFLPQIRIRKTRTLN